MRFTGTILVSMVGAGPAAAQDAVAGVEQQAREAREWIRELMGREPTALEAREDRIDAELQALDRDALADGHWAKEWAGTYYTGSGLGMNVVIKIAPESGCTYTWYGCMGLYDSNHGEIAEVFPDGVRLSLATDPNEGIQRFMDTRVYFVKWGNRRYLVPERKMLTFVSNYNLGGARRAGMLDIPRQSTDRVHRFEEAGPTGLPELPAPWDAMLLDGPRRLVVTSVRPVEGPGVEPAQRVYTLGMKGGRDRSIFEGLEIEYRIGKCEGMVVVTRVDAETCCGELRIECGLVSPGERLVPPHVGLVLEVGARPLDRGRGGGGALVRARSCNE